MPKVDTAAPETTIYRVLVRRARTGALVDTRTYFTKSGPSQIRGMYRNRPEFTVTVEQATAVWGPVEDTPRAPGRKAVPKARNKPAEKAAATQNLLGCL